MAGAPWASQDLRVTRSGITPSETRVAQRPDLLRYSIDGEDLLVDVGSGWDEFAEANGGAECHSDTVLGRPLLSFVRGREARHLYEILFQRARRAADVVSLPFRCDGPAIRRFMKLDIRSGPERSLEFESSLIRVEARPAVRLLEDGARRSDEWLQVCSWCKLVRVSRIWVEVETAVENLGLFERAELPRITHGCCASCADRILGI